MYKKEIAIKFWDDSEKAVGTYRDMNIENKTICEADIKESIRHAFRDLTVRTMKKLKGKEGGGGWLDGLATSSCVQGTGLSARFNEWFQMEPNKDEFDAWHKKTCDWIIGFLKEYYVPEDCTYGKAQKIVNMSFKNLYALCSKKNIEEQYSRHFEYCHVPLDSFTLEWFQRQCVQRTTKIKKGRISNWSAIREYGDKDSDEYDTDDGKKFYTYFFFQKKFREWYSNEQGNPLKAEFVFWPRIQLELAAEGFWFALKEDMEEKEKKEFKKKSLEEKIEEIKNKLND